MNSAGGRVIRQQTENAAPGIHVQEIYRSRVKDQRCSEFHSNEKIPVFTGGMVRNIRFIPFGTTIVFIFKFYRVRVQTYRSQPRVKTRG
jgi:hypothetical protein